MYAHTHDISHNMVHPRVHGSQFVEYFARKARVHALILPLHYRFCAYIFLIFLVMIRFTRKDMRVHSRYVSTTCIHLHPAASLWPSRHPDTLTYPGINQREGVQTIASLQSVVRQRVRRPVSLRESIVQCWRPTNKLLSTLVNTRTSPMNSNG